MLSKKCQYALHALKFMASQPGDRLLTIQDIASHENIPKKFLEAILAELKVDGILSSRMGKKGGYYMDRSPAEVTVLEVVRIIDGAVAMLPCVSLNFYKTCGRCSDESVCSINALFSNVRDETIKILSTTTISTLTTLKLQENRNKHAFL
jgi:Rrf2 family protein